MLAATLPTHLGGVMHGALWERRLASVCVSVLVVVVLVNNKVHSCPVLVATVVVAPPHSFQSIDPFVV